MPKLIYLHLYLDLNIILDHEYNVVWLMDMSCRPMSHDDGQCDLFVILVVFDV